MVSTSTNCDTAVRKCFEGLLIVCMCHEAQRHVVPGPPLSHSPQQCHQVFKDFVSAIPMLEDILSCVTVIQVVVLKDTFKVACMEVVGIVQSKGCWNELEAIYYLVKLIRGVVQDIEAERPMIGR
ncbi:hypothetical protein VNO78_06470 [Psophocarpus tetragonolobus]|uniref:Uncharacterized protein n=1 Tax=Psophocarpus tetragonolobus TaxID=3891 RepID=A0AAN9ST97_PSOTE